jgi:arginase family enzyme
MNIDIFFQSLQEFSFNKETIGDYTDIYIDNFPDWEDSDIVIIGVQENRNSTNNNSCSNGQNKIREQLYKLYTTQKYKIVDLGNIINGKTVDDTYVAVSEVTKELVSAGKFLIILGGSQDLTYANYLGYEKQEQIVNLVSIDNEIDISNNDDFTFSCSTYLTKIVLHKPNFLFNFSQLGFQNYFVEKSKSELIGELYFDKLRLGDLQADIEGTEPFLRNADILSVDLKSLRKSEFKSSKGVGPNGLFANEMCQLMKYAGMSDKLSSVGIYEYCKDLDSDNTDSMLVSQMIYFLIVGFYNRKGDYPMSLKSDNLKFIVYNEEFDHNLVFYKSPKSDRWWLEIPYPPMENFKFERHHLVPCSYKDYNDSMDGNIPDIWWKTYRKLN